MNVLRRRLGRLAAPVVYARAVVPEGHVALLSMAVLPGARTAYLQVLENSTAARSLYGAAGLAPADRCHYRTLA